MHLEDLQTDKEFRQYERGKYDARHGGYDPPDAYLPGSWALNREHDAYMLGLDHGRNESLEVDPRGEVIS